MQENNNIDVDNQDIDEDVLRQLNDFQAMNLLNRFNLRGFGGGRHSAEYTKKRRTPSQRKARRKMQAASRKQNRGTFKGQRCHKGKQYSVNT